MPALVWASRSAQLAGNKPLKLQAVTELIWPFGKRSGRDTLTGVVLDSQRGGSVAVIQRQGARLRLLHWGQSRPPEQGNWRADLEHLLADYSNPVNAVANEESYQLLLVERPDVPDAELAAAVGWRIRDLLNHPVADSVVDVFDVPPQARGSRNMVYAVATRKDAVEGLANQLRDCDAPLECIDIPELCMRNIAMTLKQDQFGVAFLLVQGRHGVLTVTRDKKLYLIRQMEIPLGGSADGLAKDAMSAIALELQRSLDYFESHYDQRPIRDVVLAPTADGIALCPALGNELAVNVSLLNLNELLEIPRELSDEEQADCLLAIGAALRDTNNVASEELAA